VEGDVEGLSDVEEDVWGELLCFSHVPKSC
jgi:hypothetical protein